VRIETSPDGELVWTGITDIVDSTNIPVPQGRQNVAAGLVAADIKLSTFKKTNFDASAILLPALSDPRRVRFSTNATYYLKLFSNLSWNLSFYDNWDNRPPVGFSGGDYGTSSGLSWTFGNR
jgi:hypothetical protein